MTNRHVRSRRGGEGAGVRALRLELLFREELNSILDGELGDHRFDGVRITLVELSRDGSRARIWYCMTSHSNDAESVSRTSDAFARASGFFRQRLCEALPLKRTPELTFRHDPAAFGPSVAGEGSDADSHQR
jgi:ribosome-binding factor A